MTQRTVTKSSGEEQDFSQQKLMRSVRRAGVPQKIAHDVVKGINKKKANVKTQEIHQTVYNELLRREPIYAAKYNLKHALMQFGPSGYPFEQFFARLLQAKGYRVSTNRVIRGKCVSHETDVLAWRNDRHFLFECKFHNRPGLKSDVQTVLYMKARYDDIRAKWDHDEGKNKKHLHRAWIVTNTQFTSEARKYGTCAGMGLISWRAPAGRSLAEMIEETGLHPITTVTSLSNKQKEYAISHGLVLCRDVVKRTYVLKHAGVRGKKLERVMREARGICKDGIAQ